MKKSPLQNPLVVASLVVAAAGALFLQLRKPAPKFSGASAKAGVVATEKAPASAAVKSEAKVGTPPTAVGDPLEIARSVDLAYIKPRLGKWIEAPNRDPFGLYPKPTKEVSVTHTNVSQILHLSAIWRQTGKRLAIINDLVATEGSDIMGYRVDRIEASVVKLSGPQGPEQITLASFDPALGPSMTTNHTSTAIASALPRSPP